MKSAFLIIFLCLVTSACAQFPRFSLATDVGLQRNFKKEQRYLVVGHNTVPHFHLSEKDGVYVAFSYFAYGRFTNQVVATAKSPLTVPQEMPYVNNGRMRAKEFSIGFRRYLKGNFEAVSQWNLYGSAGFGLLFGRVINTHSVNIDTLNYSLPVHKGEGKFKRLTFDLALGAELPMTGDFYFYLEARAWVPTTDYPSKYIFVNDNAPFMGMLGAGIRLLF